MGTWTKRLLAAFASFCVGGLFSVASYGAKPSGTGNVGAVPVQQVTALSYTSTNVSTSAYTPLVASTIIPSNKIFVCDTSGRLLRIAIGAPGAEVDLFTNQVNGCILIPHLIQAGSRLSIKAIDAAATAGYNTISLLQ